MRLRIADTSGWKSLVVSSWKLLVSVTSQLSSSAESAFDMTADADVSYDICFLSCSLVYLSYKRSSRSLAVRAR